MFKVLLDAIKELFRAIFAPFGGLFQAVFGGVFTAIAQIFNLRAGDVKKIALVSVSFAVIGGSVISLFFTMRTPQPKINSGPFEGLGQAIAEETIKVVGQTGRLVLIVQDTGDTRVPVLVMQQEAFETAIKNNSDIRIDAVEKVAPDFEEMIMPDAGMSAKKFRELLQTHQGADAIVSFIGLPMLTAEDLAAMPKRRPKVIAGAVFMPGLRDAFAWGLVEVAITPRYEPPAQTDTEPKTAKEWFDRYYSVVTKDNADSLPEYM